MYIVILMLLVIMKCYRLLIGRQIFTPATWMNKWTQMKLETKEEGWIFLCQIIVIVCISLLGAKQSKSGVEGLTVFVTLVVIYTVLLKTLVRFIEWLQDYLTLMSFNAVFATLVPFVILLNIEAIHLKVEVALACLCLLMSVFIVYSELIHIVTGSSKGIRKTTKVKMEKSLKIKSIVTWFLIIMANLYTLLILLQFYVSPKMHHFIEGEVLTIESAVDLFYYLVVTFTTVGFGDIKPNTMLAKLVTVLISISGMLFSGMFIGTILALDEHNENNS